MENGFAKGLILGGLLTTAVAVGFEINKGGHGLTDKLKKDFGPLAKHLKDNCGKLHDVTKEDFDELVSVVVDDYAKRKEIGNDSKKTLMDAFKSKWSEIKDEYGDKA